MAESKSPGSVFDFNGHSEKSPGFIPFQINRLGQASECAPRAAGAQAPKFGIDVATGTRKDETMWPGAANKDPAAMALGRLGEPRAVSLGLLSAPYRSGPSRDWIKVKNPDSPAMIRAREHFARS
jgi:hypothetical protein